MPEGEIVLPCHNCGENFTRTPSNHKICKGCHTKNRELGEYNMYATELGELIEEDTIEMSKALDKMEYEMREKMMSQCKSISVEDYLNEKQ
jgi:hypothetical protein